MKTQTRRLTGLLVILAFACSLIARAQPSSDEESVQDVYRSYVRAWKTKDLPALDKIIAPDYMAVNFEGKLSSKEYELATARDDLAWVVMTVDEIHTRVWRDTAVATGFISAEGKKADGSSVNARVRFLATLVKRDGQWQLVATQSASVKKP